MSRADGTWTMELGSTRRRWKLRVGSSWAGFVEEDGSYARDVFLTPEGYLDQVVVSNVGRDTAVMDGDDDDDDAERVLLVFRQGTVHSFVNGARRWVMRGVYDCTAWRECAVVVTRTVDMTTCILRVVNLDVAPSDDEPWLRMPSWCSHASAPAPCAMGVLLWREDVLYNDMQSFVRWDGSCVHFKCPTPLFTVVSPDGLSVLVMGYRIVGVIRFGSERPFFIELGTPDGPTPVATAADTDASAYASHLDSWDRHQDVYFSNNYSIYRNVMGEDTSSEILCASRAAVGTLRHHPQSSSLPDALFVHILEYLVGMVHVDGERGRPTDVDLPTAVENVLLVTKIRVMMEETEAGRDRVDPLFEAV